MRSKTIASPLLSSVALVGLALGLHPQDTAALPTGTIRGRIVFQSSKGEALKRAPRGIVTSDAVLYLVGDGLAPEGGAPDPGKALLDQVDIAFVPHVLPVIAGTTVEVRNSDSTTHNVHTYPHKNAAMNKTQAPTGMLKVIYDKPEVVHVGCDIHSQMSAYIVIVPNEHFTKSAKDGSFKLEGVPPGTYHLVAWHEKYGEVSQEVTVSPEGEGIAAVEVALKAKPRGGRRRARN